MAEKRTGFNFGTEVDGKWYKRYMGKGMVLRGLGKYWLDDHGLYFLRHLTTRPLFIPFSEIKDVRRGEWHSGRWGQGNVVIKIIWGDGLSSGFILGKDKDEAGEIIKDLQSRISQ